MKALPELEGQGFDTLLDKVYNTGEPYVGIDIPITLARDENLSPEVRYSILATSPCMMRIKRFILFWFLVMKQPQR